MNEEDLKFIEYIKETSENHTSPYLRGLRIEGRSFE